MDNNSDEDHEVARQKLASSVVERTTWRDKPLVECTRDELFEALGFIISYMQYVEGKISKGFARPNFVMKPKVDPSIEEARKEGFDAGYRRAKYEHERDIALDEIENEVN